ncbi:N-terminal binuclear Zn cluster-containing protein [Purpureocillium lavendulum]|uniref:N-terminal binuclear Zn cluster-containing protein n=1 Tax=Purpureocillium lavendulum TaxID=1247861 RepID=A0AB34FLV9_9HYPO|nr:N-terminal binuclear Zn cluster-containing protein [Purpureocillium lavendulum]
MPGRQIKTCDRCRLFKIKCDRAQPACEQCRRCNAECSLWSAAASSTSSGEASPASGDTGVTVPPTEADAADPASSVDSTSRRYADGDSPDGDASQHGHGHGVGDKSGMARKRRRRACLSCVRCHRLKVKCDKKLPCTRCRLSGWGRQCAYTHRVEDEPAVQEPSAARDPSTPVSEDAAPFVILEEEPGTVITTWHSRHRGLSHWRALICRLDTIAELKSRVLQYTAPSDGSQQHDHNQCSKGRSLPGNFPFNSPGAVRFAASPSLEPVRQLLEAHRARHDSYVEAYLALYQPLHPVLDPPRFLAEMARFWDDPSKTHVGWLAEMLMVLALGCFALDSRGGRDPASTVELCMAAEACLARTPFMVRPTISTMRTLCLMLLAKQVINGTCWSFDSCWALLGIVVRLAVCLGIHRSEPPPDSPPVVFRDWEAGQVLWTTILYFDVQMAVTTGMPSCISADELLRDNGGLSWTLPTLTSSSAAWHAVIHTACPTIQRVVTRVNAEGDLPSYDEIVEHSSKVRQLMGILERVRGPEVTPALRVALDVFFRRVLLVLHRRHALEPDAPVRYPISYWSSLESSLALLVQQRELCDAEEEAAARIGGTGADDDSKRKCDVNGLGPLADLYMLDFFAAALTASLHLLREDAPLADGFAIPPRRTILDTLEACTEVYAGKEHRSLCFHSGYHLLKEVVRELSLRTAGAAAL